MKRFRQAMSSGETAKIMERETIARKRQRQAMLKIEKK
jgi:hypothetical protein